MSGRRGPWLLLAACLVAVAGACSSDDNTTQPAASTTSTVPATTTLATLPPTTTTTLAPVVGEGITIALGKITVHAIAFPVAGSQQAQRIKFEGKDFAVVDIEICPTRTAEVSGSEFQIQTTDNRSWTYWNVQIGARDPNLTNVIRGDLAAGTCVRGWLTFPIDSGQTLKAVVYAPHSGGGTPVRWAVS